ncbi:MAG TPA: DUF2922 domain-containing protein [Atopostipes sp.]|nr:DUF2922 domain-containing protein [Atopostipes sp.]
MDTTVKLELQFATEEGRTRSLSVNQPAMDLDPAVVEEAMNTIAAQNIFEQEGIQIYNTVKGARYVTRAVEDVFQNELA